MLIQTPIRSVETVKLPILMYHHIAETGDGGSTISAEMFRAQMEAVARAGFCAVLPEEVLAFVRDGKPLPRNAFMITFDDGYFSNYDLAFPILRERGLRATVFAIGISYGRNEYKDTGIAITPHFGAREAGEMVGSGVFSIQSHTYDFHQWEAFESGKPIRSNILQLQGESDADYADALRRDFEMSRAVIEVSTGERVIALAYPGGAWDVAAQRVLRDCGVLMTFTTEPVMNELTVGDMSGLFELGRFAIGDNVTPDELVKLITT
ncbi:MAG: polysaccharide deacetylase family protein [Oscillospiraceae bacterium]|nr:polysaccharide deacetylase family protein [Oscillospiraceae bacterium]